MADPLMAGDGDRWPCDFRIFAGLCILWSLVLFARSIFNLSGGGAQIEDVIFGVKFHGDERSDSTPLSRTVVCKPVADFSSIHHSLVPSRMWASLLRPTSALPHPPKCCKLRPNSSSASRQ